MRRGLAVFVLLLSVAFVCSNSAIAQTRPESPAVGSAPETAPTPTSPPKKLSLAIPSTWQGVLNNGTPTWIIVEKGFFGGMSLTYRLGKGPNSPKDRVDKTDFRTSCKQKQEGTSCTVYGASNADLGTLTITLHDETEAELVFEGTQVGRFTARLTKQ